MALMWDPMETSPTRVSRGDTSNKSLKQIFHGRENEQIHANSLGWV